jgi:hypothetical protein
MVKCETVVYRNVMQLSADCLRRKSRLCRPSNRPTNVWRFRKTGELAGCNSRIFRKWNVRSSLLRRETAMQRRAANAKTALYNRPAPTELWSTLRSKDRTIRALPAAVSACRPRACADRLRSSNMRFTCDRWASLSADPGTAAHASYMKSDVDNGFFASEVRRHD